MKKFYSIVCLLCLTAMNAMAGIVNVPDVEYTSIEELDGKTFAIVNKAEGKALYGSNNQNLAYSAYADAFLDTNSGYVWKAVLDESGSYYLQLVTPAGNDYNCWGMGGVLNSQGEPQGWACSFILGTNNQKGQDIPNGALYDLVYTAEGWTIKNVGTGMYQPYSNGPANSTEPTYWSFCSLKQVDDGQAPEVYTMPESLKSMIEAGTQFYLKSGDQYLIGGEQQAVAMSDWTAALEGTNSTMWVLTENEDGTGMFRAVTADGSNVSAWGANPCYLNAQPALGGVLFKMNKDQDVKGGSSWIIAEAEGGYTLQCLANKGYASAAVNTSADAVVWELYVPAELDLQIVPAFINGKEEVSLNDHSNVSVELAEAIKVGFGDNAAAVRYATYSINELTEEEFMGVTDVVENEIVSGTLDLNTFGYAQFEEPIKFNYGSKYNVKIKAWNVTKDNLFDENFNMAEPIATITCEFNGSFGAPAVNTIAAGKYAVSATVTLDQNVMAEAVPEAFKKYLGEYNTEATLSGDEEALTISENAEGGLFDGFVIVGDAVAYDPSLAIVLDGKKFNVRGIDGSASGKLAITATEDGYAMESAAIWYNGQQVAIVDGITIQASTPVSISAIASASESVKEIFSASGAKLSSMQKGLNIVRLSDGSVKKIMVK